MTYSQEHPPQAPLRDVGATRARQGRLGRPVFWVLVVSTVLAVVALSGAWFMQSGRPHSDAGRPSAAEVQHYSAAAPTPTRSPAYPIGGRS